MTTSALDDLMAVHDQLAALELAGVPMETGLHATGSITSHLKDVNAAVARRVSQGASLDEALADATKSAPLFGYLLRVAAKSGDLTMALRSSNRLAESRDQSWQTIAFSLVYPAIVFMLAYLGLVGICLLLVPLLVSMYRSMALGPRTGLATLVALRQSLPYWAALPPLGLVLVLAVVRRNARRSAGSDQWLRWLPGLAKADDESRAASFAQSSAALLESGIPFDDALSIAAPALDSETQPTAVGSVTATRYPPFLRWALFESEATVGRQAALTMAAEMYRAAARRRLARWQTAAPIVLCVFVGGGITLLYGLALFVPIIELLQGLAS